MICADNMEGYISRDSHTTLLGISVNWVFHQNFGGVNTKFMNGQVLRMRGVFFQLF